MDCNAHEFGASETADAFVVISTPNCFPRVALLSFTSRANHVGRGRAVGFVELDSTPLPVAA